MKLCTVSPLIWPAATPWTINEMDLPIGWGEGVCLDVLPKWALGKDFVEPLSYWQKERLHECSLGLIQYYERSAIEASDPDGQGARGLSVQDRAEERVHFFVLASWLAQSAPVTVEFIIHASDPGNPNHWTIDSLHQVARTEPGPFDGSAELDQGSMQRSRELFAAIDRLPRSGPVWTALHTLQPALRQRDRGDLRVLLFWIAVEALFGPEDAREMRHRLAERMALFLVGRGEEARGLYRDVKKGYDLRSKIVHGMRLGKRDIETGERRLDEIQGWLRRSLCRILLSGELLETFSGSKRERFLDEMALQDQLIALHDD